jgi:hypothetical protein
LLNSIACSCFLESLNSTPSALVNFTFFLESKTFWSWQRKVHLPLAESPTFTLISTPRLYSSFILLRYIKTRELSYIYLAGVPKLIRRIPICLGFLVHKCKRNLGNSNLLVHRYLFHNLLIGIKKVEISCIEGKNMIFVLFFHY